MNTRNNRTRRYLLMTLLLFVGSLFVIPTFVAHIYTALAIVYEFVFIIDVNVIVTIVLVDLVSNIKTMTKKSDEKCEKRLIQSCGDISSG